MQSRQWFRQKLPEEVDRALGFYLAWSASFQSYQERSFLDRVPRNQSRALGSHPSRYLPPLRNLCQIFIKTPLQRQRY